MDFVPYENEADVITVQNLDLENRLDRITISGEVDLTADQIGLAKARLLHQLLGQIVTSLERRDLPAELPKPGPRKVPNPFDQRS